MNELDLFAAARALSDMVERAAYLDRACADNPDLRRRLDELLSAHSRGGNPWHCHCWRRLSSSGRPNSVPTTATPCKVWRVWQQVTMRLGSSIWPCRSSARWPPASTKRRFQHRYASWAIDTTITTYEMAGQLDRAGAWRRKWLAVVKEHARAESPAYAGELAAPGMNLLRQRKWADAEPILRECLTIRQKQEPDAWTTFNTASMLGGALLGQKKHDQATPPLLKGYEGLKAREKDIPRVPQTATRIPEALDRLIELYTATDKPDEAKKYQELRARYPTPWEVLPPPREAK